LHAPNDGMTVVAGLALRRRAHGNGFLRHWFCLKTGTACHKRRSGRLYVKNAGHFLVQCNIFR
jgi:hypothetical protein